MAKEIVAWCDPCMAEETRTPAHTVGPFTIPGINKPLTLDVCAEHEKHIVAPLLHLLDEFGQRLDDAPATTAKRGAAMTHEQLVERAQTTGVRNGKTPAGPRSHKCLWCPLDYSGHTALIDHVHKVHGLPKSTLGVFGRDCPLCGLPFDNLGGHVAMTHKGEVENTSQAFQLAQEQGDPHGAVKARLEAAPK